MVVLRVLNSTKRGQSGRGAGDTTVELEIQLAGSATLPRRSTSPSSWYPIAESGPSTGSLLQIKLRESVL